MNYLQFALQNAQNRNHCNINHIGYCIGKEQQDIINAVMDKKIWYVDIPRTSSTAIQLMLGEQFGFPFGKRDIPGKGIIHGTSSILLPPHTIASNVRDLLGGQNWSTLQTFSIVRDPYSWALSFWKYNRDYLNLGLNAETFIKFVKSLKDQFVKEKESRPFFPASYMQSDYLTDSKQRLIVKDVLKFEKRNEINTYLKSLGIDKISEEKLVSSQNKAYDMSEEEKKLVRKVFEKDFDILGY